MSGEIWEIERRCQERREQTISAVHPVTPRVIQPQLDAPAAQTVRIARNHVVLGVFNRPDWPNHDRQDLGHLKASPAGKSAVLPVLIGPVLPTSPHSFAPPSRG